MASDVVAYGVGDLAEAVGVVAASRTLPQRARDARIASIETERVSLRTQACWGLGALVAMMMLGSSFLGTVVLLVLVAAAVWSVWDFVRRHVPHPRNTSAIAAPSTRRR